MCKNNNLTNLNVNNLYKLTDLDCRNNQLSSLDLSENTALSYLNCNDNKLSNIDLSKNTNMESLYCMNNSLTDIDVTNNTNLIDFYCDKNKITSLDLSKNTALKSLSSYGNQYTIEIVNGKFDLTTLPGNFDVSKASNWYGGSVEGNVLTVRDGISNVDYNYDFGNGKSDSFTLKVVRKDDVVDGDVNMDGILDINDATAIQMYLAGKNTGSFNEDVADINSDGEISILDATALQMLLSGK